MMHLLMSNLSGAAALFALVMCLPLLWSGAAGAEPRGERVLRMMDGAMTRHKDQHFVFEMTTQEPGKTPRLMTIDVYIKGENMRHVEFLAPADLKGMKVLVLSQDQMYIYLPAYRKVRRVASHVKDQGFMGTTLSHDDISLTTYSASYEGQLLSETKTHYMIAAIRRPGQKVPYAKLEMDVLKDMLQPSEIRYFNDKGVKIKTEIRTGYSCQGRICNSEKLKMVDHVRNDAWTEMVRKKWEVNTGVPDRLFSLRSLQRGS